jgi:hypothetical protein
MSCRQQVHSPARVRDSFRIGASSPKAWLLIWIKCRQLRRCDVFSMHSKFVAGHVHWHGPLRRLSDRTSEAGPASYLIIFCALVGLSGFALYQALQPTRYPNPGLPAHDLRSSSGIGEVRVLQFRNDDKSGITPAFGPTIGPVEKTIGEAALQPTKHKKIDHATTTVESKRTRAVQRRQRNPGMASAAQPFPGNYRPWGSDQSWSNYRPWDGAQAWGGYRAWGSYQTSNGHRPDNQRFESAR